MPPKRKRGAHGSGMEGKAKRQKTSGESDGKGHVVKSALLAQFYPQVLTLREYMLAKLPKHSKVRQKKIRDVGKKNPEDGDFAGFLDQTWVGVTKGVEISPEKRWQQWNTFSQKVDESASTLANLTGMGKFSQSEIVDFVIWQLFSRHSNSNSRPFHLLCQGFRRDNNAREDRATSAIPGITSTYPNSHVTSMKAMPWPRVLALWGNEGERAMIDLLLDCGIFVPVASGQEVYSQMSGLPLGELKAIPQRTVFLRAQARGCPPNHAIRSPSEITFVRNRMMYARAALNAQGGVRFGLRHIHVLNRFPKDPIGSTAIGTIHVMLYIFPRQFGLHNVFTDNVDGRQTVQPFQDYTIREDEISNKFSVSPSVKVPKRLRGKAADLTAKLQVQHARCSYKNLLDHYCPASSFPQGILHLPPSTSTSVTMKFKTQMSRSSGDLTASKTIPTSLKQQITPKQSMMDYATPTSMVSAFCNAALSHLIPREFWGIGDVQKHNHLIFSRNVNRFVSLRRFENLSLHEVTQGIKIEGIEWLGPQTSQKMSLSDTQKRWEMLYEFVYYLFDSLLIPLIRSNFHVTESNVHRYRLFYFRHDVWKSLAEPALTTLKLSMFEEIKLHRAQQILDSRSLGFSQMRLLPKERGIRPIMNLRRRTIKKGTDYLGSSINSILAPVYNVLTYEKIHKPSRLGSTLFSVGDLYSRLKTFKSAHDSEVPLYFAKLDVQSAFDTIPQSAVINLIRSLATEDEYRISKHLEIKPGEDFRSNPTSKPVRKWAALAHAPDDLDTFDEALENELAVGRKNTIFVENVVNQFRDTTEIFNLLEEHVNNNMVKIGKKFYRQKHGIPQGSVLSSLLCNYFYADLESKHLGFLKAGESLLLRLIDDFLLITPNPSHAKKFLQIMHDGVTEYGIQVNPEKTLVNFEVSVNGQKIQRLVGKKNFPYCGSFIDTETLEIKRDRERRKDLNLRDSLTVEYAKNPGKIFHRKVLNTFKIQAHAMFLDTSFNSVGTVLSNIYSAFIETANKTWTYAKCLPTGKRPGTELMIKSVRDLADLAFVLMKSKGRHKKNAGFRCGVSKFQVEWLAMTAFHAVLGKRQSKYSKVLKWLNERIAWLNNKDKSLRLRLKRVTASELVE